MFPWYQGKTLIEAIQELVLPARLSNKPLRMSIREIHRIYLRANLVVFDGYIISGKVEIGMHLVVAPE